MLPEFFTEITNTHSEPHFLLTHDGIIISANRVAKQKFEVKINGTNVLNLNTLVRDEPSKIKQLLQMWSRSKSPLPGNITAKNGGDSQHYLCKGNAIRPAVNGEPALIMMQCTDKRQSSVAFVTLNENIEQLKRSIIVQRDAEKKIRGLNANLEQRVNERTAELQKANTELNCSLEELKNAQDHLVRTERLASLGSMVAGVAHEINTPVGTCVTATSFLNEKANHYRKLYTDNVLTREDFESFLSLTSESTTIMLANLGRAADLIRSFKQLAVDQTSDESRSINMKCYIEELLISLKPYFRRTPHSIEIDCPDDIDIESQPGPIAQIFNNLISNSISHGFEGIAEGKINIEVTRDKEKVLLHYYDNGCGISKKNLPKIFDPFFTTKRNQGGSGLGLNIIYNLVNNRLGGNISATSEKHHGVHFYISLPI